MTVSLYDVTPCSLAHFNACPLTQGIEATMFEATELERGYYDERKEMGKK